MRHILFGDSIGFGVADFENGGWATQLRLYIDRDKKAKNHNLINLSISGDTSRGLLARMESEAKLRMRDKSKDEFRFLIAIGTNDSRDNRADISLNISIEEFENNLNKLVQIGIKLSQEVVLIGLLPVYEPKTSPFKEQKYYSNKRLAQYNAVVEKVAKQNNLRFINLFPDWINKDLESLFDDGLHPNSKGHKVMFETIKNFLINKG
jgi:lysophospholipase L1-like esterase